MDIIRMQNYRPENILTPDGTDMVRNPYYDVGEFLPKAKAGTFEIARISMHSSTGDVISIRAKKLSRHYKISVYNEYGTIFLEFKDRYTQIPTQGEVLDVILRMSDDYQSQEYIYSIIDQNGYKSITEITSFFYLDSNLYPNLNELFVNKLGENGFK